MKITNIKLKNFKNFASKEITCSNMVLFKGTNGKGKSTLALHSILFGLYGYSLSETLKDLPTRDTTKSCHVEIEILYQNKTYNVIREYPTKLVIQENGKLMPFNTATEAQDWIDKTFGNRVDFQKFRIVDAYSSDANFLDEGQTTFKKILFAGSEQLFINIKDKLLKIKSYRELFNKDASVVYKCYPSEKRLNIIIQTLSKLQIQEQKLRRSIESSENCFRQLERKLGTILEQERNLKSQQTKLLEQKTCYICKQPITIDKQKELLGDITLKLQDILAPIAQLSKEKETIQDLIQFETSKLDKISPRTTHLRELKMKLETRIKQKDYKYTNQDVLVVKKAIDEVERLSTYYLTESIKILEPIINDILSKINFKVKFIIDSKDKFKIRLYKEEVEYKYSDLSTGQRLILQIAFKISLLLEKGETTSIIIADEGFSALSKENLMYILTLFEGFSFQLFMALHHAPEMPDFVQIIDLDNKNEN